MSSPLIKARNKRVTNSRPGSGLNIGSGVIEGLQLCHIWITNYWLHCDISSLLDSLEKEKE